MDKKHEYELLAQLERETTSTRHTTFTAIIGISFLLPGLALEAKTDLTTTIFGTDVPLQSVVFFLGFSFYLFAAFHYHWYHRYSHFYRKRLKELEGELGISIYRLRIRPQYGRFKLHFEWAVHVIGIIYAVATMAFVGCYLFTLGMIALVAPYLILVLLSYRSPIEPREQ